MVESLKTIQAENQIKVVIRVRPLSARDKAFEARSILRMDVEEGKVYVTDPVSVPLKFHNNHMRM